MQRHTEFLNEALKTGNTRIASSGENGSKYSEAIRQSAHLEIGWAYFEKEFMKD
jgi:hypothetical protein